ncbi:hypothetical protein ACIQYC_00820, partial [Lysinibacillus sp. NPDC096826]|uniref:hypothetical protein n=1 Tax=Lysinibacillus sp. NPDC096826 TaxID=3364139 RepID=UPI0038037F28
TPVAEINCIIQRKNNVFVPMTRSFIYDYNPIAKQYFFMIDCNNVSIEKRGGFNDPAEVKQGGFVYFNV